MASANIWYGGNVIALTVFMLLLLGGVAKKEVMRKVRKMRLYRRLVVRRLLN